MHKNTFKLLQIIVCLIITAPTQAMAYILTRVDSVAVARPSENLGEYVGWGGGLSEGTLTLGRDGGEAMISFLYGRIITEGVDMEYSLHYTLAQRYREWNGVAFPTQIPYTSLAWCADVVWLFQPFQEGYAKGLRFGLGPSVFLGTYFKSERLNTSWLVLPDSLPKNAVQETSYSDFLSLGINLKGEYILPITESLDLGIRAHAYLFLPVASGNSNNGLFQTGGGQAGVGSFLRVRFPHAIERKYLVHTRDTNSLLRHHVGWGINYVLSDVGQSKAAIMFSGMYAYQVQRNLELETGLHITQRFIHEQARLFYNITTPHSLADYTTTRLGYAVVADIGANYTPVPTQEGYDFRIGVSILARYAGAMRTKMITSSDIRNYEYTLFETKQAAFGGGIKFDYLLPIDEVTAIGLRLQGQYFLPPFAILQGADSPLNDNIFGFSTQSRFGYSISLGAFLRFGF